MKSIPSSLQAKLDSGVTTLCYCWKLTRADGTVMGFTDHDEDIAFNGVVFKSASGLIGSDAEHKLGLAAADMEIAGAISADAITEADLAAGKYDGAQIELWLVDWRRPSDRMLLRAGQLGRVRRGQTHFEAEVRTLAARLAEVRGRLFAHGCDAELGDARCGVNLDDPRWQATVTITALIGERLKVDGASGFAAGFFTHGRIEVISGAASGFTSPVVAHRLQEGQALLTLARTPPATLAVGDAATLVAGCDHAFATCRDKFANAANFRGFPHMPGNDFAISYPVPGDGDLDGGSMNH